MLNTANFLPVLPEINFYPHSSNLTTETQQIFEECTQRDHLRQYYFIREYAYRLDLRLKRFSGEEDVHDGTGRIFIGRENHFVFCGARLNLSLSEKQKLPLEYGEFNIRDTIPEFKNQKISELSRIAVLPSFRDSCAFRKLLGLVVEYSQKAGCDQMVGATQMATARHFARVFKNMGFNPKIWKTPIPPHASIHEHLNLRFLTVQIGE